MALRMQSHSARATRLRTFVYQHVEGTNSMVRRGFSTDPSSCLLPYQETMWE